MAKFGRLAGAILIEADDQYFLLGHTKRPCDFASHGLEAPANERAAELKTEKLHKRDGVPVTWDEDSLIFTVDQENPEVIIMRLDEIFLIRRNNMVSERIWELIGEELSSQGKEHSGNWLLESPIAVWDVVRDTVLRC